MSTHFRNHWLSVALSVAILTFGLARFAVAKKPTPPPPPAPANGTVVFACDGKTWKMNADDGSGKTIIANRLLENPSSGAYAGIRWELVVKDTGEFYQVHHPDGTIVRVPQRDLFARGCVFDGFADVEIQLTDSYGTCTVRKAHWARTDTLGVDSFISIYATDISDAVIGMDADEVMLLGSGTGENIAGDFQTVDQLQVLGEEILDITTPLAPSDIRWRKTFATSKGLAWHAWSPDGKYLAYYTGIPNGIYVVDVSGAPATHEDAWLIPITDDASFPNNPYAWSPDSSQILYRRANALRSVNPFTFQYTVLLDYSSIDGTPQNAQWSPDGLHIVYRIEKQVLFKYYYYIARTRWSDGVTVQLTGDLDKRLSKDVYLWTE